MNEPTEGSRRRDRHRRHSKSRDGKPAGRPAGEGRANAREPSRDSPREGRRENPRETAPSRDARRTPREELPPLPKLPTPVCARCGEPIQDITSALSDKESGSPMHFDCVLAFLQGAENLGPNEKIVYIGQGRFAVMSFENPSDTRKFKIVRTIEWESRENLRSEWRAEISGAFSQVK